MTQHADLFPRDPLGLKILLVEDDEDLRQVMLRQLHAMGCATEATGDASEFLIHLTTSDAGFDLAVVDLHLPGLAGDQIITWLRLSEVKDVRALPILIVTGYPQDLPDEILSDGFNIRLLTKPYSITEMRAAIEALMTMHPMH